MALYAQTGSLQTYGAVQAAGPGVLVPDAQLLFTGDYSRAGSDLVLTGSDGAKFLVTGYFNTDTPPSLISPEGAKLPGDVVMSLAGPQFPGQYAQAGDAPSGKQAIGKVESASGSASAVRADGTTQILKAGDPVFQGDVVLTGPGSKLGISFVDGAIFSLSANARMVLNSLVYDPDAGQNNSMLFSLVEGSFVFAAGQIAPTGDMKIQTPVATMGIRGTAPTVNIDSETGEVNFSIVADPGDGHVGAYTLYNLDNGLPIGTVSSVGTKWQLKSATGQIVELEKTEADLLNDANAVGQINTIYTQWQNSTQQNPDGPQAGPENNSPPSGGLNTNPQNPDAPGSEGGTGGQGGEGEGEGENNDQGNDQQSTAPPPPPTNTDNNPPPPPPPTEASGPNFIFGTPDTDNLPGTASADVIDGLAGDDTINALGGNDIIIIGPDSGVDTIDGGEGIDTIRIEGDLDIDTETFEGEVENIEIIDLNKTDHNSFTISADDVAGGLNDTLQFRGGGNPGDTLNLISEFIIDEGKPTEQYIEGSWQQLQGVLRVIDGISFDVYEFMDGQGNVLATAEVERGITTNIVFENFENSFKANGWTTINASISSEFSPDGSSSARISTSSISESGPQSVAAISQLTGIPESTLDNLAYDNAGLGNVTEGGAMATTFSGQAGQVLTFDWFFSTQDYPNFNDAAFVSIDGKVVKLFDVIASGNQPGETTTEGWNTFSIVLETSGDHTIAFGVLDDGDSVVQTSLNIDNIRLGPGGDNQPLLGGPGNDILVNGDGKNTITTGEGADRIIFGHINDGIDLITDFSDQDTLDLTGLLDSAFGPVEDIGAVINEYIQATTDASTGNTTIAVDIDGAGGPAQFTDIAILQGIDAGVGINVSIGDEDTSVTSSAIVV